MLYFLYQTITFIATYLVEREIQNIELVKNKSKDVIIAEKKKDLLNKLKNFFGI